MRSKFHIANLIGSIINSLGFKWPNLDINHLHAKAINICDYDDFGDDDYLEGLKVLIKSIQEESHLTTIGKFAFYHEVIGLLCSRLALRREKINNPAVFDNNITNPIVIMGLPRTGTTLLQSLLALDSQFRTPLVWEMNLFPDPPSAKREKNLFRIADAKKNITKLKKNVPDFGNIHLYDAELPQECILVTAINFCSLYFEVKYNIPSYVKWYNQKNKEKNYEFHKTVLQYLQSNTSPKIWVLKTPIYISELELLFNTYSNTRVIQTHRAPEFVIPSIINLYYLLRSPFSRKVDTKGLSTEVIQKWSERLNLGMNFRQQNPHLSSRFYDMDFADFTKNPINEIKNIYRCFNIDLTKNTEDKMVNFLNQHKRKKSTKYFADNSKLSIDQRSERIFNIYSDKYINKNKNYK